VYYYTIISACKVNDYFAKNEIFNYKNAQVMIFLLIFATEISILLIMFAHEEEFLDCYGLVVVGRNVL
jgi:hypothetical protein